MTVRVFGRSHATGFSMVELLLAITLMGMLLALAYGGLRASTQATEKGQKILDESNRIRMAHQFVRRQLTQMLPLAFEQDESGVDRSVFRGGPGRIRYVARMPGYLGFGGPQVQELEFVQGNDGLELVLSHALLQGFEEQMLYAQDPIFLLDKIKSAEFRFMGIDETGQMSNWTNTWEDESALPASVALDITFTEDVYLQWPMMATTVRIDSSAIQSVSGAGAEDASLGTAIRDLIKKRTGNQ